MDFPEKEQQFHKRLQESVSGARKDSLGRTYHYQNGKKVKSADKPFFEWNGPKSLGGTGDHASAKKEGDKPFFEWNGPKSLGGTGDNAFQK